ncbi:MAG: porin OmpL1 [Spirochaetia bacterium]|nr:porin OmpL1 [Spirochaetia bacterium]
MKHAKLMALGLFAVAFTTAQAEGAYLGFGFGLHFDLAGLGKTITVDGLDSPTQQKGDCNAYQFNGGFCETTAQAENQKLIEPENKYIALEKVTGGWTKINNKEGGPMVGGVFKVFYEKNWENTFIRAGLNLTRKIKGGHTRISTGGVEWYNVNFDYTSHVIPVYYGFKTSIGEAASVYAGGGVNWFRGGFSLQGSNMGGIANFMNNQPQSPDLIRGGSGIYPTVKTSRSASTGALVTSTSNAGLLYDKVKFRASGIGFNFLIGVEKKLTSGDKLFFEFEHIISGGQPHTYTEGSIPTFAPAVSYPQNLSGTIYTFGYKMAM